MKIVHISPSAPYNEGWGYQENLLPKYQAKLGHDVTLIVTNKEHFQGGFRVVEASDGYSKDGFRVIRRPVKSGFNLPLLRRFCMSRLDVYDLLCELQPDLIFYHGLASATIWQVVRYKKRVAPNVVLMQDNHLDYRIGPLDTLWRRFNALRCAFVYRMTGRYVDKVWGVTPWRCRYAAEVYGVPKEKIGLLVMGGDDEKIKFDEASRLRKEIRAQLAIGENDFVVATGGKLDAAKNVHILMRAFAKIKKDNLKLIVFGKPDDNLRHEIEALAQAPNIRYVGWIPADKVYDYFWASDLVAFPGQHSVLWEQACACGIPGIYKRWPGMDHVDVGGNVDYFEKDEEEEYRAKILASYENVEKYQAMKKVALEKGIREFSYQEIAKRATQITC